MRLGKTTGALSYLLGLIFNNICPYLYIKLSKAINSEFVMFPYTIQVKVCRQLFWEDFPLGFGVWPWSLAHTATGALARSDSDVR